MRRLAVIDTEFNGFGGELISMAICIDGGVSFYQVKSIPSAVNPWVKENVIPYLLKEPCGPEFFKMALHVFLKAQEPLRIIADWPTDIEHLMREMLGTEHGESIICDIECVLRSIDYQSRIPHNALEDAKAILYALNQE